MFFIILLQKFHQFATPSLHVRDLELTPSHAPHKAAFSFYPWGGRWRWLSYGVWISVYLIFKKLRNHFVSHCHLYFFFSEGNCFFTFFDPFFYWAFVSSLWIGVGCLWANDFEGAALSGFGLQNVPLAMVGGPGDWSARRPAQWSL